MENFQAHISAPDCNVVFYPFKKVKTRDIQPTTSQVMETDEIEVRNNIITCSTNKGKNAAGSFTVVLDSSQNWKALILPGTWCLIYMSDQDIQFKTDPSSDTSGLKMIGIVRNVRRIENLSGDGTRTVRYSISGQDFHGVFNSEVYVNLNLTQVAGGQSSRVAGMVLFGDDWLNVSTPSDVVKKLVDSLLGRPALESDTKTKAVKKQPTIGGRAGQTFKVPPTLSKRVLGDRAKQDFFTGMLTFFLQSAMQGTIVNKTEISGTHSIWSILQSYSNSLVNEMYTDLLPVNVNGKVRLLPSFVFRSIPFSTVPFKKKHPKTIAFLEAGGIAPLKRIASDQAVPYRTGNSATASPDTILPVDTASHFFVSMHIDEHQILDFNTGKTDSERFNFFLVAPTLGTIDGQISLLADLTEGKGLSELMDLTSVARYGFHSFVSYSPYVTIENSSNNIQELNKTVRDLWQDAHLYETGLVVVPGQQRSIPIGTNIEFIQRGWLGHVEQVTHSFSVSAAGTKMYRTQIAFVRLQNKDGSAIDIPDDRTTFDGRTGEWDRGLN